MKYLLTNRDDNTLVAILDSYTRDEFGIFGVQGEYTTNYPGYLDINSPIEVSSVPDGVRPGKYCYTEIEGFYINPRYVEIVTPEQKIQNLEHQVAELTLLLGDVLLGG